MNHFYRHLLLFLLFFISIQTITIGQNNFSKAFNFTNGNERLENIFSFDDGYQLFGSGISFDTISDESIKRFDHDVIISVDNEGHQTNVEIEKYYNVDWPSLGIQLGDTILYRNVVYENGKLNLYNQLRNKKGEQIFLSTPQSMVYDGRCSDLFLSKDTLHVLIRTNDAQYGNRRGYYQQMDIAGNIYSSIEIEEPEIAHLPANNKKHLLFPYSLEENIDNTILISYVYNDYDSEEYAALIKMTKNGDIIWRRYLDPKLTWKDDGRSVLPQTTLLQDSSILVLWKQEIPDTSPYYIPLEDKLYLVPPSVIKLDQQGNNVWNHTFYTNRAEVKYIDKVIQAQNGDLIGIGYYNKRKRASQSTDSRNAWIFRMSNDGELLWEHYYRDEYYGGRTTISDVLEEKDGSIVVVGSIEDEQIDYHYNNSAYQWILKLNGDGCYYDGPCEEAVVINTPKVLSSANLWTIKKGGTDNTPDENTIKYTLDDGWRYIFEDTSSIYPYSVNNSVIRSSPSLESIEWAYTELFIRQVGNKVYWINDTIPEKYEALIYDFDLEEGDEFRSRAFKDTSLYLVVTELEYITLYDGSERKQLTLRCGDDIDGSLYGYRTWIQGIGDTKGLMSHLRYCCTTEDDGSELLCYSSYEKILWENDKYATCWLTTAVEDVSSSTDTPITVHPNPSSNNITITLPEPILGIAWSIYNTQGMEVMSGIGSDGGTTFDIDISALGSSIYILKIKDQKGVIISVKKLIVSTE